MVMATRGEMQHAQPVLRANWWIAIGSQAGKPRLPFVQIRMNDAGCFVRVKVGMGGQPNIILWPRRAAASSAAASSARFMTAGALWI